MISPKFCPINALVRAVESLAGMHPRDEVCVGPECAWWRDATFTAQGYATRAAHCGLIQAVPDRDDWKGE